MTLKYERHCTAPMCRCEDPCSEYGGHGIEDEPGYWAYNQAAEEYFDSDLEHETIFLEVSSFPKAAA